MAQSVFATGTITRSATLWSALPEDILLPPLELSGRKDYNQADIAALAAEIYARGQDTPAMVRKNEKGLPVLVYGRRRYLAVQYINDHLLGPNDQKWKLEAKYEAKMSDTEALIAAICENAKRKDVNDMDHCANIERLRRLSKYSLEDVAKIYFPEAESEKDKADALRWVRERAALVELAPEAAQAVREGTLKITSAKELAKLPKDEQRHMVAEAKSKVAGKTRIKVSDVKAATRSKSAPDKPVLTPAKTIKIITAAEDLACAVDNWLEDATDEDKAEKKISEALNVYRKLVPISFPRAEGKAA